MSFTFLKYDFLLFYQEPNDHGRAKDTSDGIDGQNTGRTGHLGNTIANEHYNGPTQGHSGQNYFMIRSLE